MKMKVLSIVFSLFVVSIVPKESLGISMKLNDAMGFVTLMAIHNSACGTCPQKQYWYEFGKYRSTCHQVETKEINKYVDKLEYIEISNKDILNVMIIIFCTMLYLP